MKTEPYLVNINDPLFSRPPLVMAGPCSAESEIQIMEVAESLSKIGIDYLRAGIWKPRTHPGNFEGIGVEGLKWLQSAQKQFGIKVATEVATAKHVEEALHHGIDLLWIGARTTVNPFAVQEIAEALSGVSIPIMVKNPVNPDIGLWVGAVKRLQNIGIKTIIACHRGFNVYQKTLLRNAPLWEIPIEFKRLMPDIPLICDPSHICGNRDSLFQISQKAMDLGYEGLILEVHPNPDLAWSDAAQQITPQNFLELLLCLKTRKPSSDDRYYNSRIQFLREEINEIDTRLMELVAARVEAARKIGLLKKENGVAFYQHNRWSEVLEHCKESAAKLNLNEHFAVELFNLLHLAALDIQGE